MLFAISHPLYVFSENGEDSSRIIGFETAGEEIVEVFTEYGSVPPCSTLSGALRSLAVEVTR